MKKLNIAIKIAIVILLLMGIILMGKLIIGEKHQPKLPSIPNAPAPFRIPPFRIPAFR